MAKLSPVRGWAPAVQTADERANLLERQLERERRARLEAEHLAERGLHDLSVSRSRIELLNTISLLANAIEDPREILERALRDICAALGYSFGNAFLADPADPDVLRPAGIFHATTCASATEFIAASQEIVLRDPPIVIAGRQMPVAPAWTPGIDRMKGFARAVLARQANFRAMLTVPILSGRDRLALLEFFAMDEREPEAELLDVLMQAGLQIGGVFRRRQQADRLRESALTDSLTGLPNRASFALQIESRFAECRRLGEPAPSLIFIDLDGFKLVNDTLGHQAGDRLLIDMADNLRDIVERTNQGIAARAMPGKIDLARLAGDEFTLIVDGPERDALAAHLATEIHLSMSQQSWIDTSPVRVTASIGVAHDDGRYENVSAMLRDADLAMYEAKSRGNERTIVFDQQMRENQESRLTMVSDLRRACDAGDFILHYQPILALDTENLVGFEALIRWTRNGKPVSPAQFIPVAEESGIIVLIGQWVLREACKAAVRWNRMRDNQTPLRISINVSPRQFLQPTFVQQVRDILTETGCDPRWIALEITETAAVLQPNRAVAALEELRALSIHVGLDDFGTGYSSLSRLQAMPIDTIKIDQSFVRIQTEQHAEWSVVQAVLALARSLKLRVVVEGVETEFQRRELMSFGCEFAQGFLFSKPLSEEMATALLLQPPLYTMRHVEDQLPLIGLEHIAHRDGKTDRAA
ncbi:MAG: putative bifunctional diguanylate cyclase/phosphodiesterase [Chakrabartia sp.]